MHDIAATCYIRDDSIHILALKYGEFYTHTILIKVDKTYSLFYRKIPICLTDIMISIQSEWVGTIGEKIQGMPNLYDIITSLCYSFRELVVMLD